MTWSKRTVLAAALMATMTAPALAQVGGNPFEVSLGAGGMAFDSRAYIKTAPVVDLNLGWRANPWITAEIPGVAAFSKSRFDPSVSQKVYYSGFDLRFNLRPAENRSVPFIFAGGGYATSQTDAREPNNAGGGAGTLGLGVLVNVGGPRTYLRFQVRDLMMRDRSPEVLNHFGVTAGFHYVFGGKYKDQDLDGVRDWLDHCPNTPIGAKVDTHGCPMDADRDSVYDGIDKCPNTPKGCKVDKTGCPGDADGDGVCDGIDQCPDTPKGATVDSLGCPHDADRDSVPDGIDQCPDTPLGAKVDGKGCPIDSDGDGVPDGIDQCPNTPLGFSVDAKGCLTDASKREMELMDTGMMRVSRVDFAGGASSIPDATRAQLETVGAALVKWPTLKFEIGAHTDTKTSASAAKKLTESRAKAVLDYLLQRYPALDKSQFTTKGYGATRPIADNTSPTGRATNNRIDLVVLNKGELVKQVQSRQAKPAPANDNKK